MMRVIWEGVKNGWREVCSHKVRSATSMVGILLGVASLVVMMSFSEGMLQGFRLLFENEGGILKIEVEDIEPPEEQQEMAFISKKKSLLDAQALRVGSPLIRDVSAVHKVGWVPVGSRRSYAPVFGVDPGFLSVEAYEMAEGRFLGDLDVLHASPVAVLGSEVKKLVFGKHVRALGKSIAVRDRLYTVIGVMEEQVYEQGGKNILKSKNRRLWIPITRAVKDFELDDTLNDLALTIYRQEDIPEVSRQIESILHYTHRGIEDFEVVTQEVKLEELRKKERSFAWSLGGIAAISLLVGGVSILNVMLASMQERIREIGVRKALGATGLAIFTQFIVESVVVSTLGGMLGALLSWELVYFLQKVIPDGEQNLVFSSSYLLVGIAFSVVMGVLAGIFPAAKAARLNPITALRYE